MTEGAVTQPNLHLTLSRVWFDAMAAGEKDEEYREVKEYWVRRLMTENEDKPFREFGFVFFKNGYHKLAATMRRRWVKTEIRPITTTATHFNPDLAAVFVITLGPVECLHNYHGPRRYGDRVTILKTRMVRTSGRSGSTKNQAQSRAR